MTRNRSASQGRIPLTIAMALCAGGMRAQTGPTPRFDAATIRKAEIPVAPGECPGVSPGRLTLCRTSVGFIRLAYGPPVKPGGPRPAPIVVKGGPDWADSEFYLITATADGAASAETMQGAMMRALLEDRFRLSVHREQRKVPVYVLSLGKNKTNLSRHQSGNCTPPLAGAQPPTPGPREKPLCTKASIGISGEGVFKSKGEFQPISELLSALRAAADRPIVDKTGLTSLFDVDLQFMAVNPTVDTSSSEIPSLFSAVEGLGLKLVPADDLEDVVVIDHIERPSAN